MKSIAFTGHRPHRFGFVDEQDPRCQAIKASMSELLERGYKKVGLRRIYVGGAQGVDMWAAEAALTLKHTHNDLQLFCVMPFAGHDSAWPREERDRLLHISRHAEVIILAESYYADAYKIRNRYLVDHSDYLAAVCLVPTPDRSGTAQTIQYAETIKKPVIYIHPTTGVQYTKKFNHSIYDTRG